MSGGSMNYIFARLDEAADLTEDNEIADLLRDLSDLLHDEEWARSGDYGRESYLEALRQFKEKWFNSSREIRLAAYIDADLEQTRKRLYALIGYADQPKEAGA